MPGQAPRSTVGGGMATPEEPQTQTHTGHRDNRRLRTFVLLHVLLTHGLEVKQKKKTAQNLLLMLKSVL